MEKGGDGEAFELQEERSEKEEKGQKHRDERTQIFPSRVATSSFPCTHCPREAALWT